MSELENLIKYLENLEQRLVEDYNAIKPFYQYEEDRLFIPHVIEHLETLLKKEQEHE